MTDEIQQPEQPEVPKEPLTTNQKKVHHRGVLEKLPPEVRQELDDYIRAKNPSAARTYIINKYGVQLPILVGITKVTFYKYAKKHNLRGVDTTLVTTTPPELLKVIENFSNPAVNIDDKKAALTALYNDCAATSKKLESTQTNFLDPQIQMVILQNRKQMCTIIEKLAVLTDQLSKDSDKNWLSEAEYIIQVCTSAVVNSYKITHTDHTLFSTFMTDYLGRLSDLMKAYTQTKETLKKEPPKII